MANRMAAVVSEDSGAFTMGSLFGELGGELTRQNVSDITEALIEEGMDERTARKNARILWYVVKNGPVSGAQAQMIERNDVLAKVMREVVIDPYCTVDPQSIGYNEILRQLARETVARESGYHFGMWNPPPARSTAGGAGGRAWMSQGGDNAAVAAFVPQGEGFGSGWQETRGAPAERNGANWEAAHGAGADALDAGSSFDQRQEEDTAGVKKGVENSKNDDIMGLYRKTGNTGVFSNLPERMSKKHIRELAKEYDIGLNGLSLSIDANEELLAIRFTGCANPDNVGNIIFFPNAFISKEELLRTLFHEKIHVRQYREYGVDYVQKNRAHFEKLAYEEEEKLIADLKEKGLL